MSRKGQWNSRILEYRVRRAWYETSVCRLMALGSIAVSNRGQGNLVSALVTYEEADLEWAFAYRIGHCSC